MNYGMHFYKFLSIFIARWTENNSDQYLENYHQSMFSAIFKLILEFAYDKQFVLSNKLFKLNQKLIKSKNSFIQEISKVVIKPIKL